MKTMTFDPFRELTSVGQELDRFINRTMSNEQAGDRSWTPPLDIHEGPESIELSLEIPGMTRDDVGIEFDDGVLTVSGERNYSRPVEDEGYRRVERAYGRFLRSIRLPQGVDPEAISASMSDGVLSVTVPKAEEAKPKKISIGENAPVIEADSAD